MVVTRRRPRAANGASPAGTWSASPEWAPGSGHAGGPLGSTVSNQRARRAAGARRRSSCRYRCGPRPRTSRPSGSPATSRTGWGRASLKPGVGQQTFTRCGGTPSSAKPARVEVMGVRFLFSCGMAVDAMANRFEKRNLRLSAALDRGCSTSTPRARPTLPDMDRCSSVRATGSSLHSTASASAEGAVPRVKCPGGVTDLRPATVRTGTASAKSMTSPGRKPTAAVNGET